MKLLCCLILILLSGCVTAEMKYKTRLDSYVGKPSSEVIMAFGAPTQTYENGGQKFLTFMEDGGSVMVPLMGNYHNVRRYCKTTFLINELGLIQSYQWEGNWCG